AMKPYVHYIPLKKDLSDIFEKLSWLKDNDTKAMEISRNATRFVQENLMLEDLDEYIAIILEEYHKLQNFKITRPTLPLFTEVEY
ncbi:MAG: glycosyl transferase family 90, partial [Janthinobacterium lividum]